MISPSLAAVVSAVAAGLVWGVVCFLLSVLHGRAMKIIGDKPAPGKLAIFAYFLLGVTVMLAATLPMLLLSRDISAFVEIFGLVAFVVVWGGVQICLSLWFRTRLERLGHVLPGYPWARKSRPKRGPSRST